MDGVRVPSKSTPTLEQYENRFRKLNVGVHRGVPRLHKPCLLLAVIELAESEGLQGNRIHYGPALIERFARYISEAHPEVSPSKACYPMVYLRSDGFWRLHPKPGLEGEIQKNPKGGHEFEFLRENVEFISLDEDLHKLLSDAESREKLRNVLIDKWFQSCRENIRKQISRAREESDYEKQLKGSLRIGEETKEEIRKPVFRRLVLRAYDHSCAATGLRFPMFDGTSLLEAAHIKPFSEFHDDRTVNGMALEPTYHRAMDQYLIAPGPDLKWHVSGFLDDQINGHEALMRIEGNDLRKPKKWSNYPDREALEWRYEKFLEKDEERK